MFVTAPLLIETADYIKILLTIFVVNALIIILFDAISNFFFPTYSSNIALVTETIILM